MHRTSACSISTQSEHTKSCTYGQAHPHVPSYLRLPTGSAEQSKLCHKTSPHLEKGVQQGHLAPRCCSRLQRLAEGGLARVQRGEHGAERGAQPERMHTPFQSSWLH